MAVPPRASPIEGPWWRALSERLHRLGREHLILEQSGLKSKAEQPELEQSGPERLALQRLALERWNLRNGSRGGRRWGERRWGERRRGGRRDGRGAVRCGGRAQQEHRGSAREGDRETGAENDGQGMAAFRLRNPLHASERGSYIGLN